MIIPVIIGLLAVAGGLLAWSPGRRSIGRLVRRSIGAPCSLQRLRPRLARRWGNAVAFAPLTYAVGDVWVALGSDARGYRVEISWRGGAPGRLAELRVRPRRSRALVVGVGDGAQIMRVPESPANPIGDTAFDAALCLECGLAVALPLLTPEVMRLASTLGELTIADGLVRCVVGIAAVEPEQAVAAIATAVELAQELARAAATPVEVLLAANARTHRGAAVRLKMLQALEDRFPGGEAVQDTLRAARLDPAPIVRLDACQNLGDEGLAGLWELALEPQAPESLRVASVLALARRSAGFVIEAARVEALMQPRSAPALAVTVLRLLAKGPPGPSDVALGCRALASDNEEVLLAAIDLLAERGDATAVRPLLDAANDPTLTLPLREAARRIADRMARSAPSRPALRLVAATPESGG